MGDDLLAILVAVDDHRLHPEQCGAGPRTGSVRCTVHGAVPGYAGISLCVPAIRRRTIGSGVQESHDERQREHERCHVEPA